MRTWAYLWRRLAYTALTLLAVLTLMWAMFRLLPGDPFTVFLGQGELTGPEVEKLRAAWGLDRPLYVQYLSYLGNFLTGDLGLSFYFRRPVMDVILPALANTLILMAPAVVIATWLGVWAGTHLGWRRGDRLELAATLLLMIPRSFPIFWIGILLLMVFAYWLGWFPIGGMRSTLFIPNNAIQELPGYDLAVHLALPLLAAIIYFVADPLMIMRTSMLEAAGEDYVTFARAMGLPPRRVRAIARRNAILPVVTYTAIMVSFAFGGQVLLEVVFSWPGMGRIMVNSVAHRDYAVAQATFFFMAAIVIVLNLVIDLLYVVLDPRITYE